MLAGYLVWLASEREAAKRLRALYEISRSFAQSLSLETTLEATHDGNDPAAGKTIVVSSHILPELADLCNKVGVIEQGELLYSGPWTDIVKKAKTGMVLHVGVAHNQEMAAAMLSYTVLEVQGGWPTLPPSRAVSAAASAPRAGTR